MKGLDPVFAEKVRDWLKICSDNKIDVRITSGKRSYEEQNRLYDQGRTTYGIIVTNARGGYSAHNYGIAIDFIVLVNGVRRDDLLKSAAQIAKNLGMTWGGDWFLFYDGFHLEYTQGNPLSYFRNGGRLVREPVMRVNPLEKLKRLIQRLERVTNSESRHILNHVIERLKSRIS